MADTLRTKIRTKTTETGPNDEDKSLATKLKSSQEYLDEYKAVVDDPQYAASVPEDTRQSLKDAIARAEQAYNNQVTKNEWLEVAQLLGRAGAQFAAASSGAARDGRADMSGLNFGPGIDYGARTGRAFQEYQQGLRNVQDTESANRQLRMDTDASTASSFGKKKDFYKEALDTAKARESDAERYQRTVEMEEARGKRDDARESRRLGAEQGREDSTLLKLQEKDLQSQLKQATVEQQNAKTAASMIANMEDFSPKSIQKLESQLPGTLGKAGITPETLTEVEGLATKKGWIWNSVDKDKRNQLIQKTIIDKKQEEIKNIRQALDSLLQRRKGASPTEQVSPPGKDPKIQEYADKFKLDYEAAKKVLVGRGYSPAE